MLPEEGDTAAELRPDMQLRPYTEADASGSLVRAGRLVLVLATLMARMDQADAAEQQAEPLLKYSETSGMAEAKRPSIAFAIAGFVVRMVVVIVVLYVSLKYLHGSVFALAAGLAMGIVALTVEGLRLLRSGTI